MLVYNITYPGVTEVIEDSYIFLRIRAHIKFENPPVTKSSQSGPPSERLYPPPYKNIVWLNMIHYNLKLSYNKLNIKVNYVYNIGNISLSRVSPEKRLVSTVAGCLEPQRKKSQVLLTKIKIKWLPNSVNIWLRAGNPNSIGGGGGKLTVRCMFPQ